MVKSQTRLKYLDVRLKNPINRGKFPIFIRKDMACMLKLLKLIKMMLFNNCSIIIYSLTTVLLFQPADVLLLDRGSGQQEHGQVATGAAESRMSISDTHTFFKA